MTNREFAAAYAANPFRSLRNANGTLYSNHSGVCFSYRDSWPLTYVKDGTLYYNNDRYSMTTSQHLGLIRSKFPINNQVAMTREELTAFAMPPR